MLKFNFFADCFDCAVDKVTTCWRENFIVDGQLLCFFGAVTTHRILGVIAVTLRLISLSVLLLSLAVFSGCKMCASHTDITGSPVPNAMASDYHRAGSYFGGGTGGYYVDGYQSTASPQRDYYSEFSQQPAGSVQTSNYRTVGPTISTAN